MSARITTITPFIDKKLLLEALDNCQISYQLQGETIHLQQGFAYGAYFQRDFRNKYTLVHDSYDNHRSTLTKIEIEYQKAYKRQQEELERIKKELAKKKAEQEEKARIKAEQERIEQEKIRLEEELRKAELEQKRIEQEKKKYIESQKKSVYEKAKSMGYSIKEKQKGEKVQLILVKTSY